MSILHVVYDDRYNVRSLGGVGQRYAATFAYLRQQIHADQLCLCAPTEADVAQSHTPEYLDSLHDPATIRTILELGDTECDVAEVELSQRLQYGGTFTATELALQHGFAVHLGGGFHHASREAGSGFCIYNDLTAVTEHLLETGKARRVLIVDLDAHQGNGYEEDLWDRCQAGQVCIFDAYMPMIFPFPAGEKAKRSIHYFIPYLRDDRGDLFMQYLMNAISLPFEEFQPDFVIYNAGTDTMEGDPVTGLSQTAEAIRDRDLLVVETCRRAGIPVMMCMSGGYGERVPEVVAESLTHILTYQNPADAE